MIEHHRPGGGATLGLFQSAPLQHGNANNQFFEESNGHSREGPFFGNLDKDPSDMMAPAPGSLRDFAGADRDGFSPPRQEPSFPAFAPLPDSRAAACPEDFAAGSHLGFLSDASREPTTYALAELARENILLKDRLRATISEVTRLQEVVRQREVERGGAAGAKPSSESKKAQQQQQQSQSRYWTDEEHQLFLEGMQRFGPKDMKGIAKHVGTRSSTQVRTHAQKYFLKLARAKKRHTGAHADRGDRGASVQSGGGSGSSTNSAAEESFGNTTSNSDCYFSSYDALGGGGPTSVRWSSSPGENTSSGGDESGRSGSREKLGGSCGGSSAGTDSGLRMRVE